MSGLTLKNVEGFTPDEIAREVECGAKFVIYRYTISVLIMTFMRPSDIYFILPEESRVKTGLGFTALTLLCGWWGLPWGPIRSIQSITTNLRGGLDVTADVMRSLDAGSQDREEFNFTTVHDVFEKVGDHNRAAIGAVLTPLFDAYRTIGRAYTGLYVNTNGAQPWFVIGVEGDVEMQRLTEEGLVQLRKKYSKHVAFEFIRIGADDRSSALVEQGERIYGT